MRASRYIPLTAALRWRNIATTTREAVWALFAPVVILGGIYGGIFTPTEAAGRRLHLRHLVACSSTAR